MNEYILTEFCLLYKRLTIIENKLKELIILKYSKTYNENAFAILYRYFKNIDTQRNEKIKTFETIYKSNRTNEEKLITSVNKLYLREVLLLFSNYVFIKNKVNKDFWGKPVDVKSSEFQKKQKYLKELRNCIAHYNIKKYSNERIKLSSAMLYFEELLDCTPVVLNDALVQQVKSSKKMSIKNILKIIYETDKNYFKDDKLLIALFDDIAILNGYTYQTLPQRWSIIRQKYILSGAFKQNSSGDIIISENSQMKFSF